MTTKKGKQKPPLGFYLFALVFLLALGYFSIAMVFLDLRWLGGESTTPYCFPARILFVGYAWWVLLLVGDDFVKDGDDD